MIRFERCFDSALVRHIITHPDIWRHVTDDSAPSAECYQPPDPTLVHYLIVRDGDEILGLFMLHALNSVCWEIHTCLLPWAWGSRAMEAGCLVSEWVFEHTGCRRIVTNVPVYNRLALAYAKRAGLVEYGCNPASFLKDGKLHDQILLGISPRWVSNASSEAEKEAVCH